MEILNDIFYNIKPFNNEGSFSLLEKFLYSTNSAIVQKHSIIKRGFLPKINVMIVFIGSCTSSIITFILGTRNVV